MTDTTTRATWAITILQGLVVRGDIEEPMALACKAVVLADCLSRALEWTDPERQAFLAPPPKKPKRPRSATAEMASDEAELK